MDLALLRNRLFQQEDLNFLLTNRVPRHALTLFMGWFSKIRHPWVVRASLAVWRVFTDLDLSEARQSRFESLHDCFTRELKPGARPVDSRPQVLTSPSDGIVGACGRVERGQVLQAKGFPYDMAELFGDAERCAPFEGGTYVTLRLTSSMYHRFHAPADARLEHVTYLGGDTWNVNPIALRRIERLFCRNERAVIRLRLADGRPLALVPVAAILVASIRLHALDVLLHLRWPGPNEMPCDAAVSKGQELGWFEHGSTIIVFAPPGLRAGARAGDRTDRAHGRAAARAQWGDVVTTVDLVWFNAGGGHRAAALALEQVMAAQGRPWQVRRVNLSDVLDPTQLFRRITGFAPEDLYNKRLASGFTLGLAQELRLLQGLIRFGHDSLVERLAAHWRQTQPDLVVSLIPNFNRALHDALAHRAAGRALRDAAHRHGRPPAELLDRARHRAAPDLRHRQGHRAGGDGGLFGEPAAPHQRHGDAPALLRRGGERPRDRTASARPRCRHADRPGDVRRHRIAGDEAHRRAPARHPADPDVRSQRVARHRVAPTGAQRPRPAHRGRSHTPDVPRWMQLADFFIGKPGPGSLSEAVQCGLPVIVTCNAATMPQERWNVSWVRQQPGWASCCAASARWTPRWPT